MKSLRLESSTLENKIKQLFLIQEDARVIKLGNPAFLFQKRHINTEIALIIPDIKHYLQDKQNTRNSNSKVKENQNHQRAKNYTVETKLKSGRILESR